MHIDSFTDAVNKAYTSIEDNCTFASFKISQVNKINNSYLSSKILTGKIVFYDFPSKRVDFYAVEWTDIDDLVKSGTIRMYK